MYSLDGINLLISFLQYVSHMNRTETFTLKASSWNEISEVQIFPKTKFPMTSHICSESSDEILTDKIAT